MPHSLCSRLLPFSPAPSGDSRGRSSSLATSAEMAPSGVEAVALTMRTLRFFVEIVLPFSSTLAVQMRPSKDGTIEMLRAVSSRQASAMDRISTIVGVAQVICFQCPLKGLKGLKGCFTLFFYLVFMKRETQNNPSDPSDPSAWVAFPGRKNIFV